MTNEQHIENLKKLKSFHNGSYGADIDRAIKALEQEPCDDAISREEAIKAIYGYSINIEMSRGIGQYKTQITDMLQSVHEMQKKLIENLPSVQSKTGHWIGTENEEMETIGYYCSECDLPMETENQTRFCPNCGAKMFDPQESEDKR